MKRSNYMLAALTSAVLPNLAIAGVRGSTQPSATDEGKGIDQAVVQDASGKLYDVYATDTKEGRARLTRRVQAAQTLVSAREPGGLGFDLDRVIAFTPGDEPQIGQTTTTQSADQPEAQSARKPGPTGETAVMIAVHREGQARSLDLLTLDDCASVGTALGAIHRLPTAFLSAAKYPVFTTGQIRSQLTAWIKRLRSAGHVPQEITNSWARIIETEGLWSFSTCMVHGGFSDGDFLFSGSAITAVTNWQDMQVNDPARDLAWIFGKLDESHRNAVLSAYGRMMGSRLDDLIMLRANLWLQMEQVGDFIQALNRADNNRIMQFKAQVERLAHQLGVISRDTTPSTAAPATGATAKSASPSTITVGTLLREDDRRYAEADDTTNETTEPSDETPDPDRTGSAEVVAAGEADVTPAVPAAAEDNDQTAGSPVTGTGSTKPQPANAEQGDDAVTITLKELIEMNDQQAASAPSANVEDAGKGEADDDTNDRLSQSGAETTVIPLLEREERALRDARTGLAGYDDEGNPLHDGQDDTPSRGVPETTPSA
ncbi:phosphotransferase [Bifidobacterium breve]|uniref:phosphotransferase n=1 Tax=Bifidobacterium breve TaxID=1685 RepID=UPI00232E3930|nr:phosphotransferase [Bifidobacterium breve]MDB1185718.1 phosphotransferase [Bifidobacterium breve]